MLAWTMHGLSSYDFLGIKIKFRPGYSSFALFISRSQREAYILNIVQNLKKKHFFSESRRDSLNIDNCKISANEKFILNLKNCSNSRVK